MGASANNPGQMIPHPTSALDRQTDIQRDLFGLLPVEATDTCGLVTSVDYNCPVLERARAVASNLGPTVGGRATTLTLARNDFPFAVVGLLITRVVVGLSFFGADLSPQVQASLSPHDRWRERWRGRGDGQHRHRQLTPRRSCLVPAAGNRPHRQLTAFPRHHSRSASQLRPAPRRAHCGQLAQQRTRAAHLNQSTLRDGGTVAIQSNAALPLEGRPESGLGKAIQLTRTPPAATPLPARNGPGPGRRTSDPLSSRQRSPR